MLPWFRSITSGCTKILPLKTSRSYSLILRTERRSTAHRTTEIKSKDLKAERVLWIKSSFQRNLATPETSLRSNRTGSLRKKQREWKLRRRKQPLQLLPQHPPSKSDPTHITHSLTLLVGWLRYLSAAATAFISKAHKPANIILSYLLESLRGISLIN